MLITFPKGLKVLQFDYSMVLMSSNAAFKVYEEYVDGALSFGDGTKAFLTFWNQPPLEWSTKYHAKIEKVEKGAIVYSVLITDEAKIDDFIRDEMPAFKEYILIARKQFDEERKGVVLRLAKQLLFDSKAQRQARLYKFKDTLQR
jgi:hypothetical protein